MTLATDSHEQAGGGGLAGGDYLRDAHPLIGISRQRQAGELLQSLPDAGYPAQMSQMVLRHRSGPPIDLHQQGVAAGPDEVGSLANCQRCQRFVGEFVGGRIEVTPQKHPHQHAACGGAVGEF